MSEWRNLPVVGALISDEEWPEVEGMIKAIESCHMKVIKILKFIHGSTKFIACKKEKDGKIIDDDSLNAVLADHLFKIVSPYSSKGKVIGHKVVYDETLKETP